MNRAGNPYNYVADPTKGRPLFNSDLYFGVPDLDPEVPANQIQVYLQQEDGTPVAVSQPVETGAGGVPMYNGSPAIILIGQDAYSFKALDRNGTQVYYQENAEATLGGGATVGSLENYAAVRALNGSNFTQVSVAGHTDAGDGGGGVFIFDSADTTSADNGGTVLVDSGGGRWKFRGTPTPKTFGASGDGVTDDTAALAAMFSVGGDIDLPDDDVYLFSELNISQPFSARGKGSLRYDGSAPSSGNSAILISASFSADVLRVECDGAADIAYDLIQCSADDINIGRLELIADNQRLTLGGSQFYGSNISISELRSVNVARPFAFVDDTTAPRSNIHIGHVYVQNYIRALKFNYLSNFSVDSLDAKVRWSGVTVMTPGYNGILIEGCSDFSIGDCVIHNAPEHSVRIGGVGNTSDYNIGRIYTKDSSGCAVKINVDPTYLASNGSIGEIVAVNTGEGSGLGNKEVVRLTRVKGLNIGEVSAYEYCTRIFTIADVENINVGTIYGENIASRAIQTQDSQDSSSGNINGFFVSNLVAFMDSGARSAIDIIYSAGGRSIANLYIMNSFCTGFSHFMIVSTGTVIAGNVFISGSCTSSDVSGIVENPVATTLFMVKVNRGEKSFWGQASSAEYTSTYGVSESSFDPTGAPSLKGAAFASSFGTAGIGNYGAGYSFSRVGSSRRGAAIAAKQITSDQKQVGLAFFVGNPGSSSTDAVTESMVLKHTGVLNLSLLPTSSAGLVSGDIWNNSGVLNIVP